MTATNAKIICWTILLNARKWKPTMGMRCILSHKMRYSWFSHQKVSIPTTTFTNRTKKQSMIAYEDLRKLNASWEAEYKKTFEKLLNSGWYVLGEEVKEFEREFAAWNDQSKYCVGVANGLDALILALRALNLPKGSEVIVPSNTYIATILSIIHNDLTPILAEPDLSTYNLSAKTIEPCISSRTSAILVVHLYGKCCPMDEILALAKNKGIHVIEDCAQSHGAKHKNKICGNFGVMAGFSFYPTKNLGALGDAGAVVTNEEKHFEAIKQLRNYGS